LRYALTVRSQEPGADNAALGQHAHRRRRAQIFRVEASGTNALMVLDIVPSPPRAALVSSRDLLRKT
jgi:hypothetical protein